MYISGAPSILATRFEVLPRQMLCFTYCRLPGVQNLKQKKQKNQRQRIKKQYEARNGTGHLMFEER
jgi:hypothetical protein